MYVYVHVSTSAQLLPIPLACLCKILSDLIPYPSPSGDVVNVYNLWEHKTYGQFGSANLVVPEATPHYWETHQSPPAHPSEGVKNTCFDSQWKKGDTPL